MADNNPKQISMEISPEMAGGVYSNLAIINHSASEFVLDFAQMMPGAPKPRVASRIVLTPDHAKRLLAALSENVSKYESEYGEIKMHKTGIALGPIGEA